MKLLYQASIRLLVLWLAPFTVGIFVLLTTTIHLLMNTYHPPPSSCSNDDVGAMPNDRDHAHEHGPDDKEYLDVQGQR
jgi:hypothetical protein